MPWIGADAKNALFYDSVADMKLGKNFDGSTVITNGYYKPNDGGGGTYIIRTKKTTDVDDGGSIHFLNDDLVAELIVENGIVNVKQFGAKCNISSFDSSSYIQNAIDFCWNKYENDKSLVVFIPSGIFYVKNIKLYQQLCIFGYSKRNSILKLCANSKTGDCVFEFVEDNISATVIKNLTIDGNKDNVENSICYGLKRNKTDKTLFNCELRDINISNFTGSGIFIESPTMEWTLNDLTCSNNKLDGLNIDKMMDSRISDCTFSTNGRSGFYLGSGTTVKINNVKCFCNSCLENGFGFRIKGYGYQIVNLEIQENYADGCCFDNISDSIISLFTDTNNGLDYDNVCQSRFIGCNNCNVKIVQRIHSYVDANKDIALYEKHGVIISGKDTVFNSFDIKTENVTNSFYSRKEKNLSQIKSVEWDMPTSYNKVVVDDCDVYDYREDVIFDISNFDVVANDSSLNISNITKEIFNDGKVLKIKFDVNSDIGVDGKTTALVVLQNLKMFDDENCKKCNIGDIVSANGIVKSSSTHLGISSMFIYETNSEGSVGTINNYAGTVNCSEWKKFAFSNVLKKKYTSEKYSLLWKLFISAFGVIKKGTYTVFIDRMTKQIYHFDNEKSY